MKRLGILVAIIVGIVVLYRTAYPSVTVRYRLTLNAEVDGQAKMGSGVIEVSYGKNPQFLGASAEIKINVRGEAVALDLGSRRILFALLRAGEDSRSSADWIVLRAFNFPGGALPSPVKNGVADVRQLSGKVDLSLKRLPLLVRFRDISDPKTVEKVDPLNLTASFGPGVRLTGATLEIASAGIWPFSWYGITGEPITTTIGDRLPWLLNLRGGYLGGGPTSRNAPLGLHGGDFKRG